MNRGRSRDMIGLEDIIKLLRHRYPGLTVTIHPMILEAKGWVYFLSSPVLENLFEQEVMGMYPDQRLFWNRSSAKRKKFDDFYRDHCIAQDNGVVLS